MQSVRDENNGDALFGHASYGIEQSFRFLFGEDGGRLIKDEELEIVL